MIRVVFVIWLTVWVFFLTKSFIKERSASYEYIQLAKADFEGRRAIAYGSDFYQFLKFCKDNLPEGSRFQLVGIQNNESIDLVRAFYYLYPCLVSENPDYILVYKTSNFEQERTALLASWHHESFILRVLKMKDND